MFVQGIEDATALFSGSRYSCAIRAGGTVSCWGANATNMLGDGGSAMQLTPVAVRDVSGVDVLARGFQQHTCVGSTSSSDTICWGDNSRGQLGAGNMLPSTTPVTVDTAIGPVVSLAVSLHTCAVTSGNELYCWGDNGAGMLGDGTQNNLPSPFLVPGVTGAQGVTVGLGFTCVRDGAGVVTCWGFNRFGQLGDGTTTDRATPADVTGSTFTMAAEVSAGSDHVCALRMDSNVFCWGRNNRGQLGVGGSDDLETPTPLSDITNITQVASGSAHTCALRNDGAVFCWGANDFGQLGDGRTDDQNAPVQVMGLPGN